MSEESGLRFRRLTPDDWRRPDPLSVQFAMLDLERRQVVQMDGDDWAAAFLGVVLSKRVPDDIVDLFDVAKSTMVFGWFFYPMFRAGEDQLHRVCEAAAKLRWSQSTGRSKPPRFEKVIEGLVDAGLIPAEDRERWDAIRYLRNRASHASEQVVMPPGQVLTMLKSTAKDLDLLFAPER